MLVSFAEHSCRHAFSTRIDNQNINIIRPDSYYPSPATVTATTLAQTSGNADQVAASLTARF